jgi:hypothetical protein
MKDQSRILFLEETHRILDLEVNRLTEHNPFNPAIIDLKKQKLKIKDEITQLKSRSKNDE